MASRIIRSMEVRCEALEARALLAAISFGAPLDSPLGAAFQVAAGDVNGDGLADAIVGAPTNVTPASVRVHLGLGDGHFDTVAVASLNAGSNFSSIVTADFNHDGELDVACATSGGASANFTPNIAIFLGYGDGTFDAARTSYGGADVRQLAAADVNEDGAPDLVLANYGMWSPPLSAQPPSYGGGVLLGNGDGTFQLVRKIGMIDPQTNVATGDVNGDGHLDAAFGGPFLQSLSPLPISAIFLSTGDGAGLFNTRTLALEVGTTAGVATGDFNRDHRDEVAAAHVFASATTLRVLFVRPVSTSTTTWTSVLPFPLALSTAAGVSVADFNRDGRPDISVAGADARTADSPGTAGALAVFSPISSNSTTPSPVTYFMAGPIPVAQAVADVDHDGRPDVLLANSTGVTSLLNTSHPSLAAIELSSFKDMLGANDELAMILS
jgi:hypothetical protein